jgi:glycosyltransferase involved in cell wall biosynthesis
MGLELLLEAWGNSLAELPAESRLLIAGEGPLQAELHELAGAPELQGSVSLLGRVSDQQLLSLYRAADIAVVPTTEHEGFGLVVLEAAACGTQSIVTAAGGLPEAVAGLDPSLIVPVADAGALSAQLLRAAAHPPDRRLARDYAERHGWAAVAARHRQINRRAAGNGAAADNRLKVVFLDHVARPSGGEIAMLRLLPHLDRVNPHVILAEDGPLVERLHLAGCSTEVLPFNDRGRELHRDQVGSASVPVAAGMATAQYVLKLAARLRRLQPDLVHSNSLKSGVYGSLAARLAGIPMVWHVRDRIAADYMPNGAVVLIRQMLRRLPAAVIANSQTTMSTLNLSGSGQRLSAVVADVIDPPPVRTAGDERPLTYGVVGRLAPWKGQDLFLRAFARAFPEGQEQAVLVGGALFGEDEYAQRLPGLAQELGIGGRTELRGHRHDIWEELTRIDVLVHSSITPEPFGQVILEGMAASVPVIAAAAGGPAEILRHDETGVLYKPSDVGELADAMVRMQDRGLRRRLSEAARGSLESYAPPVIAQQLQQLYADTLAER